MNPGLTYRESTAAGASPVRLVILLYEQAIEDLRRAIGAQARGDIEGRTREINHALLVIGHLQATLDGDQGGQVAQNLERFYGQVRAGLTEAQFRQSAAALEQQVAHLTVVHDAWCEVEKAMTPTPAVSGNGNEGRSPTDWSA
jgi:flagellar protein FliS